MSVVRAAADPAHPEGGHAIILLQGVMDIPADPRFRILREGWGKGTLGPEGWQVSDALIAPDRAEASPQGVRLYLGPQVVDWLEAGPVIFRLPEARIDAPLFWPDVPPLHGGSGHTIAVPPPPAPRAAPTPPAPPPLPGGEDPDATIMLPRAIPAPAPALSVPQPAAMARRGSALPWILLALLLLAAAAGGAYWWFVLREPPAPPPEQPPTSEPVIIAPEPLPRPERPIEPPPILPPVRPQAEPQAPVTLDGLSVPEVVARAASPAAIAAEAARRYESGRYDDALLLWEAAARAGHAASLTRLAGLYDPVGFTPGRPFRDPDPRQAARHYREAVTAGDQAAAEPRARLRQWLDDRAREGDINAPLTIRDFWQ